MTAPLPLTHWPPDSPCYKCGKPIGEPWSRKLIPRRPVCPVCAWENIQAALFGDDDTSTTDGKEGA